MNSNTPKRGGKSAKSSTPRPRWPAGHPLAGKFAPRDLWAEYQANVKAAAAEQKRRERNARRREKRAEAARAAGKPVRSDAPKLLTPAQRREKKNADLRAARAKTRAARNAVLAQGNHVGTALHDAMGDWGSTSASRLREGAAYWWHGAFVIEGVNPDSITQMLNQIGSSARTPRKNGDGTYSVVVTPGFSVFDTKTAFSTLPNGKTFLQDQMDTMQAELEQFGGKVTPLGAFYNPERIE